MQKYNTADIVKSAKIVKFYFYRDKTLFYKTDNGFEFPITIEEAGTATFLAEDKPILFMRWIRKHVNMLNSIEN